tara:strand:+ start:293 stop:556 length:264 start_codon:yes stop_codon:yes gene_type:complete
LKERASEASLVSITFGGKKFTDKTYLWAVFSLAIICIILVKIGIDCGSIGVITSSSFFTEAYQNVTKRDADDDSSEYLLEAPELFEE